MVVKHYHLSYIPPARVLCARNATHIHINILMQPEYLKMGTFKNSRKNWKNREKIGKEVCKGPWNSKVVKALAGLKYFWIRNNNFNFSLSLSLNPRFFSGPKLFFGLKFSLTQKFLFDSKKI